MIQRLKYVYIILLIISVCILVSIVQGIYFQESKYSKLIEFNRIDGYDKEIGKITEVSIRIKNDDSINHNYTILTYVDSNDFSKENIEVGTVQPFTYSIQIPIEKKFINSTIFVNESINNISFKVYRDDHREPLDQIEFKFN